MTLVSTTQHLLTLLHQDNKPKSVFVQVFSTLVLIYATYACIDVVVPKSVSFTCKWVVEKKSKGIKNSTRTVTLNRRKRRGKFFRERNDSGPRL
jgi:hypothetical protein